MLAALLDKLRSASARGRRANLLLVKSMTTTRGAIDGLSAVLGLQ